jgi:hypothetical protein
MARLKPASAASAMMSSFAGIAPAGEDRVHVEKVARDRATVERGHLVADCIVGMQHRPDVTKHSKVVVFVRSNG